MDAIFDYNKESAKNPKINVTIIAQAFSLQQSLARVGCRKLPSYQLDRPMGQSIPHVETKRSTRLF
jgi:hypothetical protein